MDELARHWAQPTGLLQALMRCCLLRQIAQSFSIRRKRKMKLHRTATRIAVIAAGQCAGRDRHGNARELVLCVSELFCCIIFSVHGMSRKIFASLLLCSVGGAFGGVAAFPLLHARPASCHASGPRTPMPQPGDHQCCAMQHDRAMPKEAVNLRPPAIPNMLTITGAVSSFIEVNCLAIRQSALIHSGGPPNNAPLRI